MFEPSSIQLSRSAFGANLAFLRERLGDARFCSVVKGNAYGHGIQPFVRLALDAGVDYFAVYSTDEAYTLVSSLDRPVDVFIMGAVEGEGLEWAISNGVECCIHDHERLNEAIRFAVRSNKKARLHIEIETGMHRTGFVPDDLTQVVDTVKDHSENVDLVGLFTHFAGAESQVNDVRVTAQAAGFTTARQQMIAAGLRPRYAHQACSAAVLNYPGTIGEMARVGILQYGFWPNPETWFRFHAVHDSDDPLRRVISWHSSVMAITEVKAGGFIGYGTSCEATHAMRVAVVPVGYSHGFDRGLSNYGKVLVRGQQARVTGIVNMNAISVDVTSIEGVEKGDPVVLIGEQDGQRITVASFSDMSEQLNYEMLTRLPRDIPRTIIN
jgi:alanine racemase